MSDDDLIEWAAKAQEGDVVPYGKVDLAVSAIARELLRLRKIIEGEKLA